MSVFYTVYRGKRRDKHLHKPMLFNGKLAWEGSEAQHNTLQLAAIFGVPMRSRKVFYRDTARKWDESQHPRAPEGSSEGGQFTHSGGYLGEGYAAKDSADAMDQHLTKRTAAQWRGLDSSEQLAVFSYSSGYSSRMNKLASGRVAPEHESADIKKQVKFLTRALETTLVPENLIAYRGFSIKNFEELAAVAKTKNWESLIGKTFHDEAFQSTTTDYQTARDFVFGSDYEKSKIVMRIKVPQGAKGLYLGNNAERTKFDNEYELLLQRGGTFQVTGVSKRQDNVENKTLTILEVTLIAQGDHVVKEENWDESKHPREPRGSEHGGEFTRAPHAPERSIDELTAEMQSNEKPASAFAPDDPEFWGDKPDAPKKYDVFYYNKDGKLEGVRVNETGDDAFAMRQFYQDQGVTAAVLEHGTQGYEAAAPEGAKYVMQIKDPEGNLIGIRYGGFDEVKTQTELLGQERVNYEFNPGYKETVEAVNYGEGKGKFTVTVHSLGSESVQHEMATIAEALELREIEQAKGNTVNLKENYPIVKEPLTIDSVPKVEFVERYAEGEKAFSANEYANDTGDILRVHYFDTKEEALQAREKFDSESTTSWLGYANANVNDALNQRSYAGTEVSEDGKYHIGVDDALGTVAFDHEAEALEYIESMNEKGLGAKLLSTPKENPDDDYSEHPWDAPDAESSDSDHYNYLGQGKYEYDSTKDPSSSDYEEPEPEDEDYADNPWDHPDAPSSDSDHYVKVGYSEGMYGGKWAYHSSLDPDSGDYEDPDEDHEGSDEDKESMIHGGAATDWYEKTRDQYDALDDDQKEVIKDYSGSYSRRINTASGEGTQDWRVDTLAEAIDQMPFQEDEVLWSATNLARMGVEGFDKYSTTEQLQALIGQTMTSAAFVSTSISRSTAKGFMKEVRTLVKIEAPEGTKGVFIDGARSDNPGESEVLLQKNTSFVVTGVSQEGDYAALHVRVVTVGSQTDVNNLPAPSERYAYIKPLGPTEEEVNAYHEWYGETSPSQTEFELKRALERLLKGEWNEAAHPRESSGTPTGGQFASADRALESSDFVDHKAEQVKDLHSSGLVDKLLLKTQHQWATLDADERVSLRDYTGSYSRQVNKVAALGKGALIPRAEYEDAVERIGFMSSAIQKMSLPDNQVVYSAMGLATSGGLTQEQTGVERGQTPNKAQLAALVGGTITTKAFVSTSLSGFKAGSFMGEGRTMMRIEIPKGTPAAFLENSSTVGAGRWTGGKRADVGFEAEVLLDRGSHFVVTGVSSIMVDGEHYDVLNVRMVRLD